MTDPTVPAPRTLPAKLAQRGALPKLDEHLVPERLARQHGDAITKVSVTTFNFYDLRRSADFREAAKRTIAAMPSVGVLARVAEDIATALALMPDRKVTQAAVAVLFDSRVRGPQNPEIYLDALVYDLIDEGFPPAVIVGACQALRRESTFTPEIAEVIACCRKKASNYRALASLATRACQARVDLEDAVRAAEQSPSPYEAAGREESLDWDGGDGPLQRAPSP